jgi:hypothetical protein
VLTLTGFLSRRKALTFSNKGLLLLVGDYPIRQLVLYEKDFVWMVFWELNPEVLGSLWLMASATWGGGYQFGWSVSNCSPKTKLYESPLHVLTTLVIPLPSGQAVVHPSPFGSPALTLSLLSSPLVRPSFYLVQLVPISPRARLTHRLDDGGSKHLWNISKLLPDYTAQHPRRHPSSN